MMIVRGFVVGLCLFVAGLLVLPSRAQFNGCTAGFCSVVPSTASCTFPTLTNIIGRYRADTGVTAPGGNVTVVLDQSAAGNNLVNSGTVPLNLTSAYNSHPAFDFAAGNDAALVTGTNAVVASVLLSANITSMSAFFVGRMNTATADFGRAIIIAGGSNQDFNTTNNITVLNRNSGGALIGSAYDNIGYGPVSVTTGTNHRVGMVVDASTVSYYLDGSVVGSPVSFPGLIIPKTADVASSTNIVLGNSWNNGSVAGAPWDGPILETLISTSAFSPTNVANLDAYYVCQYGT